MVSGMDAAPLDAVVIAQGTTKPARTHFDAMREPASYHDLQFAVSFSHGSAQPGGLLCVFFEMDFIALCYPLRSVLIRAALSSLQFARCSA
jgi:hypothetical protein